jgi:hypothetical protein
MKQIDIRIWFDSSGLFYWKLPYNVNNYYNWLNAKIVSELQIQI